MHIYVFSLAKKKCISLQRQKFKKGMRGVVVGKVKVKIREFK